MQVRAQNIIRKQLIDLVINTQVDGLKFQAQVDALCRDELTPKLESLLERYNAVDRVIELERLVASVEYSSLQDFDANFAVKIIAEIERILAEKLPILPEDAVKDASAVSSRSIQLLAFFLRNGYLPWWAGITTAAQWQQLLNNLLEQTNSRTDWSQIVECLPGRPARERLIDCLNDKQFWTFLEHLSSGRVIKFKADLDTISLSKMNGPERKAVNLLFKEALLRVLVESGPGADFGDSLSDILAKELKTMYPSPLLLQLSGLLSGILKTSPRDKDREAFYPALEPILLNQPALSSGSKTQLPEGKNQDERVEAGAEIYIENAGLVLVAAYLPTFFRDLKLLSQKGDLNADKAIALLQYMLKGTADYEEFEVVLPKVLCGFPLRKLPNKVKLNKMEKKKAEELLESVIEHWTVLKSTSVDGLRISFLQRPGKLTSRNSEWHLLVQQKSYDMLLAHLPWTIGVIKLPWMKSLLNVEWA